MIDEIQVENLALIRKAALEPASGLTVLTGETGAGKTALVSALKLLMGERADKGSVRDGAGRPSWFRGGSSCPARLVQRAKVPSPGPARAGRRLPRPVRPGRCSGRPGRGGCAGCAFRLRRRRAGGLADEGELVATRRVGADGRSRVTMNGRMASVGELARAWPPRWTCAGSTSTSSS